MSDSIRVFNNLSDENLHFESKEEFDRYYKKNKETIDKMSTRALNMKISIDGYKLGRLKKELTLFPVNGALGKRLGSISDGSRTTHLRTTHLTVLNCPKFSKTVLKTVLKILCARCT